jgi:hypothetical protein
MHRTSNGRYLDINALKIQQENTVAVGNSRMNARGDILGQGGQVVKTRDEIMTEFYNRQKASPLTDSKIFNNADEANAAAVADIFAEPIANGYDQIEAANSEPTVVEPKSGVSTNNGIADAQQRSAELAERMRAQRSRI